MMEQTNPLEQIRTHLIHHELEEAFTALMAYFQEGTARDIVLAQNAIFVDAYNRRSQGLLTEADASVKINHVTQTLLSLLSDVENGIEPINNNQPMELAAIASLTLTTLTPFLIKGGEAIAKGIGSDIWGLIKKPFQKNEEEDLLEEIQQAPEDDETRGAFKHQLKKFLKNDPELAKQLEEILTKSETQQAADTITLTNSQNAVVKSNLNAGGDIIIGGSKNSDPK
ncbi:MAG: hypothetical protein AAFQ92_19865 [Bacteroidota bacterium]